ncbi:MAG: sigma-70 family RNA polymerase sigma factor [Acidobacteriota bacterium]
MPPPRKSSEDGRTVDRVLAGDIDAFEEIVVRWQTPLLHLAFRFCRDRGLAEEMTQEAFVKVFRSVGRWRRDAEFSTWMFSVALNHYRTVLRRRVPPRVELSALDAVAATSDASDAMEAAAHDEIVRRAVTLLPPKYRDTIVLYYFHQQDVADTARTLNTKPGTVKARLHRARKLLATKLRALGHPRAATRQEAER